MIDETKDPQLRPASANLWYSLATIAGEVGSSSDDTEIVAANQRYWNGWWNKHADFSDINRLNIQNGEAINLPTLSPGELEDVRRTLMNRGLSPNDASKLPSKFDMSDCSFGKCNFSEFIWLKDLKINGSSFFDVANFSKSTFAGKFDASDTIFHGTATCNGSKFFGSADFSRSNFAGRDDASNANFVDFSDTKFNGTANFSGANFSSFTLFPKAIFSGEAKFDGDTIFGRLTIFFDTNFSDEAQFHGSTFISEAWFDGAIFSHDANFSEVVFGDIIRFSDCIFKRRSKFVNSAFQKHPPHLFQAELHQDTDWRGVQLPQSPVDIEVADMHCRAYERLSHIMRDLSKPFDEHMFFRAGMRVRRVTEQRLLPRIVNWAYEFSCNYGYGVERAAKNFAVLWLLGTVLLYGLAFADPWKKLSTWSWYDLFKDFAGAAAVSGSNMVAFLGLGRTYLDDTFDRFQRVSEGGPGEFSDAAISCFNMIGGFQSVLGVIALFFLLLALRNRFKMH